MLNTILLTKVLQELNQKI